VWAQCAVNDPVYVSAMRSWIDRYLFQLDTSPLAVDAGTATPKQRAAAEKFAQDVHSAVTQLKAIDPPASIKDVHAEFLASMAQLADAVDKYVAAIETGKQAEVTALLPTMAAAQARLQSITNVIAPDVGIQVPQAGE
jgi:hypothetical protein